MDFQELRHSLEFSQEQIDTLTKENNILKDSVHSLTTQLTSIVAQNKAMKESILDLKSRSMRDNLVFTGIPEQTPDDPEESVTVFIRAGYQVRYFLGTDRIASIPPSIEKRLVVRYQISIPKGLRSSTSVRQ